VGTSRLLGQPLAAIVQGSSSSGKSYTIEQVARLFPPESVIRATRITPQALYHMPPGSLEHKFVVAGERSRLENDDTAEATRALREMISSGKLTKLITTNKTTEKGFETDHIEQKGPIAYIESTTSKKIFPEDANRCLMLRTDEGAEQTRRVMDAKAKRYAEGAANNGATTDAIIQRHHALQRMLKPYPVVIPYAPQLSKYLPDNKPEARRVLPQILGVITTVTLLHQIQREKDKQGRLVSTEADYIIARGLLQQPVGKVLGKGISMGAQLLLSKLRQTYPDREFDTSEAGNGDKSEERTLRNHLHELERIGCLKLVEASIGSKSARWKLTGKQLIDDGLEVLPTVDELFRSSGFQLSG
jgi:hypothetical protein